jgi:hypothetical protein
VPIPGVPAKNVLIPTIVPKSPFDFIDESFSFLKISCSIINGGREFSSYPNPPSVMITEVTIPEETKASPVA